MMMAKRHKKKRKKHRVYKTAEVIRDKHRAEWLSLCLDESTETLPGSGGNILIKYMDHDGRPGVFRRRRHYVRCRQCERVSEHTWLRLNDYEATEQECKVCQPKLKKYYIGMTDEDLKLERLRKMEEDNPRSLRDTWDLNGRKGWK
jgi:hypothetical protein